MVLAIYVPRLGCHMNTVTSACIPFPHCCIHSHSHPIAALSIPVPYSCIHLHLCPSATLSQSLAFVPPACLLPTTLNDKRDGTYFWSLTAKGAWCKSSSYLQSAHLTSPSLHPLQHCWLQCPVPHGNPRHLLVCVCHLYLRQDI